MGTRIVPYVIKEDEEDPVTIGEFIDALNIPYEAEEKGNEYVIALPDSNAFSEVYNIISNEDGLHVEEESKASDEEARFTFYSSRYEVRLEANFEEDVYRMTVGNR